MGEISFQTCGNYKRKRCFSFSVVVVVVVVFCSFVSYIERKGCVRVYYFVLLDIQHSVHVAVKVVRYSFFYTGPQLVFSIGILPTFP